MSAQVLPRTSMWNCPRACASFIPPRLTHGCSGSAMRSSPRGATVEPELSASCPFTKTRRAMISACAFDRVSTRPRSTSARSRRARLGAVALFLVAFAARWPVGDCLRRNELDGANHVVRYDGIGWTAAVFQNVFRLISRVEQIAAVVCAVALIASEQQHFAGKSASVKIRRITVDRFVEQRLHVSVEV